MFIKYFSVAIALFSVTSLTGCGSKTDANEENFGAAISQYLDKKGDLCIATEQWPVDFSEQVLQEKAPSYEMKKFAQVRALESVGLVKGDVAEVDRTDYFGKPTGEKKQVRRYTLTGEAKPFVRETDAISFFVQDGEEKPKNISLCWGKQALDKIVKWEGPIKLGDYQEAGVTYRYKVINLADWAQKDEIIAAFPEIKKILADAGQKEARRGVFLTSEGWEAKGLKN